MIRRLQAAGVAVVVIVAVVALAGCTSSGPGTPASTTAGTTITGTGAPATAAPTAPVVAGPTTTASGTCPLLTQTVVQGTLGMRQGRQTVLRSGGKVVGCRFYAQQRPDASCDAVCLGGEHLPGANQPVAEVIVRTYPSPAAAHNAFGAAAAAGTGASTVTLRAGVPGITYRTTVDPSDGARDWACGFSTGTTGVLVRVAEYNESDEASSLATAVLRAL